MAFIRSYNPVWLFENLVGQILDDSYYIFFLQNSFPYLPSPLVFHDPDGTIPWSNPIQLLANGTMPVDVFFSPNTVYRIEIRQGPTQADALIYLVENYVPSGEGVVPPIVIGSNIENQLTNTQFFNVDFV